MYSTRPLPILSPAIPPGDFGGAITRSLQHLGITPRQPAELVQLMDEGVISNQSAQDVLPACLGCGGGLLRWPLDDDGMMAAGPVTELPRM